MGFFFNKQGQFKIANYTLFTLGLTAISFKNYFFNIYQIKDDSMLPFFKKGEIIYCNNYNWNHFKISHGSKILNHRLIAIKSPFDGLTHIRRMIGFQSDWVIRADNSTFRQIPTNHIWVECENPKEQHSDSLT